jgi:hypothetical protein
MREQRFYFSPHALVATAGLFQQRRALAGIPL